MTKKIITVATFIAASVAFANAADEPTPTFTPTLSGTDAGSWTTASGSEISCFSPTSALYWSSATGISNLITQIGADTDAQTATLSTWVKFDDLSAAGNLFTVASRGSADISSYYGYQLVVASDGSLSVSQTANSTGTLGTIQANTWTMVTLVVEKTSDARNATASLYLDGALASSGATDVVFGTNLNGNGLERVTLNTATSGVSLADFKVYEGIALSADNVSALYAGTKAIPEPSLFGVLAGLGALALVGTRRRRK